MDRRTFIKISGSGLFLGVGSFTEIVPLYRKTNDFDLILKNGEILDGTGHDSFNADIGIKGDRIVAVGNLHEYSAYRFLDVTGLVVSPGFIDVHSHSEEALLVNPKAESKIRQGVTTEIVGQDGGSVAPLTEEMRQQWSGRLRTKYGIVVDWFDLRGYFEKLMQTGVAVNIGSLVGQGTLREYVMGMTNRPATNDEVNRMQELALKTLQEGALGISSGLEYTPGGFATSEEIAQLCKAMKGQSPAIYATHMRNEDDRVVEAVEEAIRIAQTAEVGLHVSHLKCQGQRNWGKLDQIFNKIKTAKEQGTSVTMDRYPYLAYSTGLSNLMPIWSREGGTAKFIERLQNPETIQKIKKATLDKVDLLGSWDSVMITSVTLPQNKHLEGQTIAQIVRKNQADPFDFTCSLIIAEENQVGMVGFGMSEENTQRILAHPDCMPASDGSALANYGPLSEGNPHPRSYGTFPRVLSKYVREAHAMSLSEAIHKMTNLPAKRFGLENRGQIAEGFFADLVVFDKEKITDKATFSNPHQYPEGIEYVMVNGKMVIEKHKHTGDLPGMILTGTS